MNDQEILVREQILRNTKPETPDELHAYIKHFYGLDLVRGHICENHQSEFDYICYSFFKEEDCVVHANRGGGKCGRFTLPLKNGKEVFVGDIKTGDEILSLDEDYKISSSFVKKLIPVGKKTLFKVKATMGRETLVTKEHPFFTPLGWKPIASLRVGDWVALPRALPCEGKKEIEDWKLIVGAYLIGDGNVAGRMCKFTNTDSRLIEDLSRNLPNPVHLIRNKFDPITYSLVGFGRGRSSTNPVIDLMKEWKLYGKNARKKFIPPVIFESPKIKISLFLSRLYSCDGWVDKRGVGYTSASFSLASGIQNLLLRFGILSYICSSVSTCNGKKFKRHTTTIRANESLRIFASEIGIFSKQGKLEKMIAEKGKSYNTLDSIPIQRATYSSTPREKIKKMPGFSLFPRSRISKLANSDIYWAKIKEINPYKKQEAWDVEIEGTHNFIGDGFFLHNTMAGAILTNLESIFKPGIQTRIVGGSKAQAEKMYAYTEGKWERPGFKEFLLHPPLKSKTSLRNGSMFAVLTQSVKSVRGERVHRLRCDEVDEFEKKVWKALQFATKSSLGIQGSLEILSTIHRIDGIMVEVLKRAEETGTKTFQWCILDILEPCGPEFECKKCSLREDCQGMAKTKTEGFYSIRDAQKDKIRSDEEDWQVEALCKKPGYSQRVFSNWDDKIHIIDYFYNPAWPIYRAFDFGSSRDPFNTIWFQVDSGGNSYAIDEIRRYNLSPSECAEAVEQHESIMGYHQAWGNFAEPAGSGYKAEFNRKGMYVASKMARVIDGVHLVRARLKKHEILGKPTFFITRRCVKLISEMEAFSPERLEKGIFDHSISCCRYFFVNMPRQLDVDNAEPIFRSGSIPVAGERPEEINLKKVQFKEKLKGGPNDKVK